MLKAQFHKMLLLFEAQVCKLRTEFKAQELAKFNNGQNPNL